MMNHLIFSRFEPLVSNREIKIIHFDNSKMRLSIFSKMGKDPKKPKDDATVKKEKKTFPVRMIVVRFSHHNRMQIRESCPRKAGPSKPFNCEDCGERFESERIQNNRKRNNICGQKKKRKNVKNVINFKKCNKFKNVISFFSSRHGSTTKSRRCIKILFLLYLYHPNLVLNGK